MKKKINKIACVSLAAILTVGATGLTNVLGIGEISIQKFDLNNIKTTQVDIIDVNLRKALNQILIQAEDAPITVSQLQGLRSLDLSGLEIEDLSGLENCTNLTAINLRNNKIKNINAMSSLTNLKQLLFDDNEVEDLSSLGNLDQLTKLTFNNNKVKNIDIINELDQLVDVYAKNNQITTLPNINKTMNTLILDNNSISDISPLSNIVINKSITLSSQQITGESVTAYDSVYSVDNIVKDISNSYVVPTYSTGYDYDSVNNKIILKSIFVSGGRKYSFDKNVIVGGKEISFSGQVRIEIERLGEDIIIEDQNLHIAINESLGKDPISQITNLELQTLKKLDIGNKNIENLKGLEICENLEELIAPNNNFNNLNPLENLTKIKRLNIIGSNVIDIEPIKNLTNLQLLYIDMRPDAGIKMQNLDIISNFTDLRNLSIVFTGATNLDFLTGLDNITRLHIRDNNISDLSPLSDKSNLQYLAAQRNKFNTIEPILNLQNISELFLSGNRIEDIEEIPNFTKLTRLHLTDTGLTNIENLVSLVNLKELVVSENNIVDFNVLANLTSLERLSISENPIKNGDISFVKNLSNLQSFYSEKNAVKDISSLANLTQLNFVSLTGNNISDISSLANLNLLTALIDEQTISLDEVTSNGNNAKSKAFFIKGINGNNLIIDKISSNGVYNDIDGTVTWNGINNDRLEIMEFSEIVVKTGIVYSGTIQQPIKYYNDFVDKKPETGKNPTTGTTGLLGILGAMGLAGATTLLTRKRKNK